MPPHPRAAVSQQDEPDEDRITRYKMNNLLLRVNEVAALLNVSRWTVYRWVEEGKLSATKSTSRACV